MPQPQVLGFPPQEEQRKSLEVHMLAEELEMEVSIGCVLVVVWVDWQWIVAVLCRIVRRKTSFECLLGSDWRLASWVGIRRETDDLDASIYARSCAMGSHPTKKLDTMAFTVIPLC